MGDDGHVVALGYRLDGRLQAGPVTTVKIAAWGVRPRLGGGAERVKLKGEQLNRTPQPSLSVS